jgi:anthranilate phosphoribosyltransferase
MNQSTDSVAGDDQSRMRSIIQRIATGPTLSKDITLEEARAGMRAIFNGRIDPAQAAIFLIALRMKRETDDENKGILDALQDVTEQVTAEVDEVVDIADPYDGYNRYLPASPFLPAVLAACGVPAVSHGLEAVGPKFGVTHRHVLQAAGIDVDLNPGAAAARLGAADQGWAYVDQRAFAPRAHDLVDFRRLIVKRQALTTVEVMSRPVSGRRRTHLVTGYVHKPYPPIYAMLARHGGFDSALIVRGLEGGVIPSLRQPSAIHFYHDRGEEQGVEINPLDLGIAQSVRGTPLPPDLPTRGRPGDEIAIATDIRATAAAAAETGLAALRGEPGPCRDALVYAGAIVLNHVGKAGSLADGAAQVRAALDSGAAAARMA